MSTERRDIDDEAFGSGTLQLPGPSGLLLNREQPRSLGTQHSHWDLHGSEQQNLKRGPGTLSREEEGLACA